MSEWAPLGEKDNCKDLYCLATKTLSIFVGKGHFLYPAQWAFCCPKIGITSYRPLGCSIKGEAFNEALTFCKERLSQMFKELEDL